MGFNAGQNNRKTQTSLSEINVTPLVDVMLVLLIVFMISAPLMQQGIQVDLPKANAPSLAEIPEQIVITLDSQKKILLDDQPIDVNTLMSRLGTMARARPDIQVFLKADEKIPYGFVAEIMAEIKNAKVSRVGLVTIPK